MDSELKKIEQFVNRLKKIGINVTLTLNFPWIYLDTINGKRVTETFQGNHGFTIAFYPIRKDQQLKFTDIWTIFDLIRRYQKREKDVFLIYKGWIDPMENHDADGYEPVGFVATEEEAQKICDEGGYFTAEDCWSVKFYYNEKMPKYKYHRLTQYERKQEFSESES